jgi:LysR family transcriptional regulator, glycine cleavage system transcriptional activator
MPAADKEVLLDEAINELASAGRDRRRQRIVSAHLAPNLLLSLQAFDAAVRLGSFKEAAAALRLTPSAISHRIRNLEDTFGVRLFERLYRAVLPTNAGKKLAAKTERAFGDLIAAVEDDLPKEAVRRLRLSMIPLFGANWLMPRLSDFLDRCPDIELAVESTARVVDFGRELFDAGIRTGDGNWPGLTAVYLLRVHSTPIAQPTLARRLNVTSPADLLDAPLIHVSTMPDLWHIWLKRAGVPAPAPKRGIWVDSFDAALYAAEQGAGVTLGMEPFFTGLETLGRLCRLLPLRLVGCKCWLVYRANGDRNSALEEFKQWLLAKVETA